MGSASAILAAPEHFLLLKPCIDTYLFDAIVVIQDNTVMNPFFIIKIPDHLTWKLRTESAALGSMLDIAADDLTIFISPVATATAGRLIRWNLDVLDTWIPLLLFVDNHPTAGTTIETTITKMFMHNLTALRPFLLKQPKDRSDP